jgi:hypothetical protein
LVDDRLRERSKLVYGNRDRLQVAVAVARSDSGLVNATDLAEETGLVNTRVRAQLIAFAEAGLLEAMPPDAGKRWYSRVESPFWRQCLDLAEEWSR